MPITHPQKNPKDEQNNTDDVKLISEEEYRERMREELKAEVKKELMAKQKKVDKQTDSGRNRHQFSLRFQPQMFQWLTQAAENESRSITNLITTYLELVQHIPTWELRQILDNEGRKRRSKRNR